MTNVLPFVTAVFYFSGVARGFLGAAGAPVRLANSIEKGDMPTDQLRSRSNQTICERKGNMQTKLNLRKVLALGATLAMLATSALASSTSS